MKKSNLSITLNKTLINLPTPSSISYLWNWGSSLGLVLMIQIMTGIFLASQYNSNMVETFDTIINITRNTKFGYQMRFIHMNMASLFFITIFIHMGRSMFMSSFKMKNLWMSGMVMVFMLMGTAFLGYVLPWGQMSFWGATVITNLLSAIPYMGQTVVEWLWGDYSISKATLNRFFTLHFLMPLILAALAMVHLMILHLSGSNNPIGSNQKMDMISFNPFFSLKDLPTLSFILVMVVMMSMMSPFLLGDPENFNPANPLNTPTHIQPEWYFLFAYAILRSIPNKLGGVVGLLMSIMVLFYLPFNKKNKTSKKWYPENKVTYWSYIVTFSLLTWGGAMLVEPPFEKISKMSSAMYFFFAFCLCF